MPSKILLADDSVTIQKVVELTFSEGDYQVTCVSNGKQALEQLDKNRPDIIICDIIMPEMSGYDVAEFVKKNPAYSAIPIVLLTGTFEPFDEERARKSGAEVYVTKPFDSKMLVEKVESLLAQKVRVTSPQNIPPATMFQGREEYNLPGVVTDEAVKQMDFQAKEKAPDSGLQFPEIAQLGADIPEVASLPPELPSLDLPQIMEMPMPGEKGEPAELKGFDAIMEPPVPAGAIDNVLEATASSIDNAAVQAVRAEISAATEAMGVEPAGEPDIADIKDVAVERKIDSLASDFVVPEIPDTTFEEPKSFVAEPPAMLEAPELKTPLSDVSIEDIVKTGEEEAEGAADEDVQIVKEPVVRLHVPEPPTFVQSGAGEVEIGAIEEEPPDFMAGLQAEPASVPEPPAALMDSSVLVTDLNEQAMMVGEGQKKADEEMAAKKEAEEFEEAQEYPIQNMPAEEAPAFEEPPAVEEPAAEEEPPVQQAPEIPVEPEPAPAEKVFLAVEEPAPKAEEPAEALEEEPVQAEPARAAQDIQVSREMVEEVVRKVISDLAPDIVRNIAWEVIPELANSIIKKRIEELEKEAE